jgi:hypothetical protein
VNEEYYRCTDEASPARPMRWVLYPESSSVYSLPPITSFLPYTAILRDQYSCNGSSIRGLVCGWQCFPLSSKYAYKLLSAHEQCWALDRVLMAVAGGFYWPDPLLSAIVKVKRTQRQPHHPKLVVELHPGRAKNTWGGARTYLSFVQTLGIAASRLDEPQPNGPMVASPEACPINTDLGLLTVSYPPQKNQFREKSEVSSMCAPREFREGCTACKYVAPPSPGCDGS